MVKRAVHATFHSTKRFAKEFRKHLVTAILAAFGFLLALTWNDFVKKATDSVVAFLGLSAESVRTNFIIAILVTIIAVLGIIIVSKLKPAEEPVQQ